jgi:hypothetical protein
MSPGAAQAAPGNVYDPLTERGYGGSPVRHPLLPLLTLLTAALVALVSGGTSSATAAAPAAQAPVPSLEPAKTEALWRSLVTAPRVRESRAQAVCRPLRAVFYAASDWLRLATKLAATPSPCAEYYVSVPPLVADKTQFRRDQASRIRALGPSFHALAEIHFATWTRWVASTGSSWHTAGVTARQRMADAGYDVSLGDSWVLNELTTAVRRGDGNARANIREFLRGLYEGDGSRPTRGAVFVIGFGQRTLDLSVYQRTLQGWLEDAAFWTDMAQYVADWSQEVYGDVRSHAVPGEAETVRREYLNDYLQHALVLASVGPETIEPARAFLREAYSPLANAAWERDAAYGWTMVDVGQMSGYVSSQVAAMRSYSASAGQTRDHWGFAWAPRNTTGMAAADFAARTGQLLDRVAVAIRDSGDLAEVEEPGSAACGADGALCAVDVVDAQHNEAWRGFRAWSQSALTITAPAPIPAGTPSAALTVSIASSVAAPITATLRSSSAQGTFSTSPVGPWTPTLSLSVAPTAPGTFYYRDTLAGRHTLTVSAPGVTAGTQSVTVTAGPAASISIAPTASQVRARNSRRFTATTADAFGNAAPAMVTWTVSPTALGTISPRSDGTATFTAGRVLGTGTITASAGTLTRSAALAVTAASMRIASLTAAPTSRGLRVLVGVLDGARRPISKAELTLVVTQDGRRVFRGRGVTGSGGKVLFRVRTGSGCFRAAVVRAKAQGFQWTGRVPQRSVCRR